MSPLPYILSDSFSCLFPVLFPCYNNNNNNNKAPNGLSFLGWLMGRVPDTYKMSHKARAIYNLWQSSPILSLHEAELFSLIGMVKRQGLVPSKHQCSGYDKLVALPAVILGEGNFKTRTDRAL